MYNYITNIVNIIIRVVLLMLLQPVIVVRTFTITTVMYLAVSQFVACAFKQNMKGNKTPVVQTRSKKQKRKTLCWLTLQNIQK